jgi:hypothetical protein
MGDACGLSIIDRRLRALKLPDEFVAGRKALVHGDEVAFGRQHRRGRDRKHTESAGDLGPFGGVHMYYPQRLDLLFDRRDRRRLRLMTRCTRGSRKGDECVASIWNFTQAIPE